MKRNRLILEMALLFCTFFLSGYVSQAENLGARLANFNAVSISYIVVGIPQILLTLYIIGIQGEPKLADFGVVGFTKQDPMRILAAYLGIFAILVPIFFLALSLPPAFREALTGGYRWGIQRASQLPLALAIGLVAGYREELFFRAYLLTRMDQLGVPAALSVAATALLFASGHIYEGIAGIAVTAIQGIYLAIVFLRVKNLHVVAIAHALYNFTVFCVSLFSTDLLPRT